MLDRAELKKMSKSQLKGHWKVPIMITVMYILAIIAIYAIENYIHLGTIFELLISLGIQVWIFAAIPNFYLRFIEKQGEANPKDLLIGKDKLLKSLGCVVLIGVVGAIAGLIIGMTLVSTVAYSIFGYAGSGSILFLAVILFIVSILIIIFTLSVSMTSYILLDKEELGVFKIIGKSMNMMKGYKWKLFVIYLSFIGWIILSILTLGIGFLWLNPYISLTIANFYNNLEKNKKLV